ncbi:MAG: hypothetical protein EXR27_17245 [Betaproteobacteria bacterium]|nr:hypothetical protein [Betaproteobacteria bacterium]
MNMMLMVLIALLAVASLSLGVIWLFLGPKRPGTRVQQAQRGPDRAKDQVWAAVANRHRDYR